MDYIWGAIAAYFVASARVYRIVHTHPHGWAFSLIAGTALMFWGGRITGSPAYTERRYIGFGLWTERFFPEILGHGGILAWFVGLMMLICGVTLMMIGWLSL